MLKAYPWKNASIRMIYFECQFLIEFIDGVEVAKKQISKVSKILDSNFRREENDKRKETGREREEK